MKLIKRFKGILQNREGFALLFVLATMLFLLALGVSALTAAGNSHRAVLAQNHRHQLIAYAGSMEQVVRTLLEEGALAEMILHTVWEVYSTDEDAQTIRFYVEFDPPVGIEDIIEATYTVAIEVRIRNQYSPDPPNYVVEFPTVHVWVSGGHRVYTPQYDPLGNPIPIEHGRTPMMMTLDGMIVVEQVTTMFNRGIQAHEDFNTRVVYHFTDGLLVEPAPAGSGVLGWIVSGSAIVVDMPTGSMEGDFTATTPSSLSIVNRGDWRVTGHYVY